MNKNVIYKFIDFYFFELNEKFAGKTKVQNIFL